MSARVLDVALGGFGNVSRQLLRAIAERPAVGLRASAVSARDLDAARQRARQAGIDVPVVPAAELADHARVVVECATYDGFRAIVEPALLRGCHVLCVSIGALGVNMDLLDVAAEHGGTIHIASGAMPGLAMLRAAREGDVASVRLTSHILPRSLAHEAYVHDQGIDLERAEHEAVQVFAGTAREAARHFPRHFNVAVALSLAGIGLDRTEVQIFADGRLAGARHRVQVKSDVVDLDMTAQNFPSPDNNRTSRIVAPSILAALREIGAPLRVGS